MMSKNELKANHNAISFLLPSLPVGKYDVKERIESKSQHQESQNTNKSVGKYDVKERIESKSQHKYGAALYCYGWQI